MAQSKLIRGMTEKNPLTHPLQSWEWGEFREKTGVKVVRFLAGTQNKLPRVKNPRYSRPTGSTSLFAASLHPWTKSPRFSGSSNKVGCQVTIHKIPYTPWTIGYLPKGPLPTKEMVKELTKIGEENNCIFIQLEPNVETSSKFPPEARLAKGGKFQISNLGLRPSIRPLFTKYNFIIDLTKTEEELLAAMHPKTRYNIHVAQKHDVTVEERTDDEAFKIYLKLYFETTKRQHYFGHTKRYHELMWKTLTNHQSLITNHKLTTHLLIAYYTPQPTLTTRPTTHNQQPIPLVAWLLLQYKDTLYYPYGGSSEQHKNVMASNLVMWEAMKLGKKLGCKTFNLWGALGPNPDPNDPWYGFHRFKQGYGGKLVEYVGSYDLILNPFLYLMFHLIDKVRWLLLRAKSFID